MAEPEWDPKAIFDAPVTRQIEELRLEVPPGQEAVPAVVPAIPDGADARLRAALEDPELAREIWQRVELGAPLPSEDAATDREDVVSELAMSLYLLQMVHSQNRATHEHLPRRDPDSDRKDPEPKLRDH